MAFSLGENARRRTGTLATEMIAGEEVDSFIPFQLPPVDPALVFDEDIQALLARASHALGKLDGVARLSKQPDLDLLIYAYLRREAVLSSQIEGTQSSLDQLLLFEADQSPGVPVDDVRETLNYLDAIYFSVEEVRSGRLPISNRLIREAHNRLLSGSRGGDKQPGEFRKSPVWLGGPRPRDARFVPPPWQSVPNLMADLERFIHNQPRRTEPLVKAALAHAQFETIHPFHDGNGRVGRLLIALILSTEGLLERPLLYLSLFFKRNRDEYYELLNRVRSHGEWEEWLRFFLLGVYDVSEDAVSTASQITELLAADRGRILTLSRGSSITAQVFEYAATHVLVVPQRLASDLAVTPNSANAAIARLAEAGILRETTGRRRNRVYSYGAYLAILNRDTAPLPS